MNEDSYYKKKASAKQVKKRVDQLDKSSKNKTTAVALKYDLEKGKAPKIMALGEGSIAEMILQVAEDNKVPFYEDESLADLLSKLDLESEIPPELFSLVAEVFSFVYQLDQLAKKREKVKKKYG